MNTPWKFHALIQPETDYATRSFLLIIMLLYGAGANKLKQEFR